MLHRRHFLKSTAAAIAALILPRSLFAWNPDHFYFIHADTGEYWPITDPVQWSLQNAHAPILARAAEGLSKLTASDGDRIVRLVTRRCRLNLIERHADLVVVHHWGQQGMADIKPFFKEHGLARMKIEVVLRDRKKEIATAHQGDSFLYGDRIAPDIPLNLFQKKWESRFEAQADDWSAAPGSSSGYAWVGVEDGAIPWAALKSAWRRSAPGACLNCSGATLLANFGLRQVGMFNRSPRFVHVCGGCRRSFSDESVKDVGAWIEANLDAEARPGYEMVWGKKVDCQITGWKYKESNP